MNPGSRLAALALIGLPLGPAPVALASPDIGDKAPPVRIAQWITQAPPALPGAKDAGQHVFLIEFWATWCPPCAKSIPHLAELYKKHRAAGLVILGISNEEPETVAPYAKRMKMPYHVGIDDDMETNNAWMDDINGIPHAFLVDKSGTVVWSGNPLDTRSLDTAVEQVLAGKYDLDKAKAAATEVQRHRKYMALSRDLQMARASDDRDEALKLVDRMIKIKPRTLQPWLIKRNLLIEYGRASKAAALDAEMEDAFAESVDAMGELVSFEFDRPLPNRDAAKIWRLAARLETIDKGRDPDVLALLARVRWEFGLADAAIGLQTLAAELVPPELNEPYKKVLTYYKTARAIARKTTRAPDDR